jgi:hypothetical protein
MLAEWSKKLWIATIEKESARTTSLNGSRADTHISERHFLAVEDQLPRSIFPNGVYGSNQKTFTQSNNFLYQLQRRLSAWEDGLLTSASSSDQSSTLRVDDLQKVLAGGSLTGRMSSSRGASPLRLLPTQSNPQQKSTDYKKHELGQ